MKAWKAGDVVRVVIPGNQSEDEYPCGGEFSRQLGQTGRVKSISQINGPWPVLVEFEDGRCRYFAPDELEEAMTNARQWTGKPGSFTQVPKTKKPRVSDLVFNHMRNNPGEMFNQDMLAEYLGLPVESIPGGLAHVMGRRNVEKLGGGWWRYQPSRGKAAPKDETPVTRAPRAENAAREVGEVPIAEKGLILEVVGAGMPCARALDTDGNTWFVFPPELAAAVDVLAAYYMGRHWWDEAMESAPQPAAQQAPDPPPESKPLVVASQLRRLRDQRAVELEDLAMRSTLAVALIKAFEAGTVEPDRDHVVLLARAYRMEAKDLAAYLGNGSDPYGFSCDD